MIHSNFFVPRSKRYLFFAFATAFCWSLLLVSNNAIVSGAGVEKSGTTTSAGTKIPDSDTDTDTLGHSVIDLTSKTFGTTIGMGDGNVWLIEFYTPTCSHCVTFAQTYQNIAATFHSSPEEKIRVARVDCSVEKALMTRFGIEGFPSFYLVSGWDVYKFEGSRDVSTLIDFARGGYKKKNVRTRTKTKSLFFVFIDF